MLDWTAVETVMLDMDGTLLDLYYDNHFWLSHLPQHYAGRHGLDLASAREQLISRFASQHGTLNWYSVDFWSHALELDIGLLKHETAELIAIRPSTLDFLQALRQSGRATWLVTNAHHKSLNLKLDRTGIGQYFDRIICSHDFDAPKESQDFWQRLRGQEPFDPARSLLIDDSISVLASAKTYGIGQLLTIAQPDSQRPVREGLGFPALHSFAEIMPIPPHGAHP
jgi:putative hydrolase of the HAD superfamily